MAAVVFDSSEERVSSYEYPAGDFRQCRSEGLDKVTGETGKAVHVLFGFDEI